MSLLNCFALIPARSGSKGIRSKNFAPLAGQAPWARAVRCATAAGIPPEQIVVSADIVVEGVCRSLLRPAHLAQDDTPMLDVVTHALEAIPGPPDQIVLLVQPTQPLRQPKHLIEAVARLKESGAHSVVSVVEMPPTHHPFMAFDIYNNGLLYPYVVGWSALPTRRQDVGPAYIRDGTVYAFRRQTVQTFGNIYGRRVCPYIIPPSETCPLDTPEDWQRAEERLSR